MRIALLVSAALLTLTACSNAGEEDARRENSERLSRDLEKGKAMLDQARDVETMNQACLMVKGNTPKECARRASEVIEYQNADAARERLLSR